MYLILSDTRFQSNQRKTSEQVLNGFSSMQFLETTYARHVGLLSGGFCVFDVINTITSSAHFVCRIARGYLFPRFPLLHFPPPHFPLPHFQRPLLLQVRHISPSTTHQINLIRTWLN